MSKMSEKWAVFVVKWQVPKFLKIRQIRQIYYGEFENCGNTSVTGFI